MKTFENYTIHKRCQLNSYQYAFCTKLGAIGVEIGSIIILTGYRRYYYNSSIVFSLRMPNETRKRISEVLKNGDSRSGKDFSYLMSTTLKELTNINNKARRLYV